MDCSANELALNRSIIPNFIFYTIFSMVFKPQFALVTASLVGSSEEATLCSKSKYPYEAISGVVKLACIYLH